jgi:Sulfotransferase family
MVAVAIAVNRLRVAYVDVSKAASTSIKLALRDALRLPTVAHAQDVHSTAWPHVFHAEERPHDFFVFSCVRHPVDRIASAYANKAKSPEDWRDLGHPSLFHFGMSFDEFVQALTKLDLRTANRHVRLQSAIVRPFRPDTVFKMESTLRTNWWTVGIGNLDWVNASKGVHMSTKTRQLLASLCQDDMREYQYR